MRRVAMAGGMPLMVAQDGCVPGVIHLKDIVKPGIRDRFAELRRMGIRTVTITGDNPLVIVALIPLALKAVRFRPASAGALLSRNLLVYGLGGLLAPFIGIKLIDMLVDLAHLA